MPFDSGLAPALGTLDHPRPEADEENPLAAPEWTLPARRVVQLAGLFLVPAVIVALLS